MTKTSAAALAALMMTTTFAASALAQAPEAAPPAAKATPAPRAARETATAAIAGGKVSIEYGRPALNGRKMEALLSQLPEDRIWRAGVDQVTTLSTDRDILIGGTALKAGKYSVYLHLPATGNASLVLNTDPGIALKLIYKQATPDVADALWPRLDGYSNITKSEVARIPLTAIKPVQAMDKFLIAFEPAVNGVSALTFTWGDQAWSVGVKAVK
jgi:hypothetical protein